MEPGGRGVSPQGHYDEMSTARLTWLVLDRLVPAGEEVDARAALIARDPDLQAQVTQGLLSEDGALEILRSRQFRYGTDEGFIGDRLVSWTTRAAALAAAAFLGWLLLRLAS